MSAVIDARSSVSETHASIDAPTLRRWLEDGQELAVIDVRSTTAFAKGEPLYASNLPAAELLAQIDRFVPRKAVRTVLVDDNGGDARHLAALLRERGWTQVVALDGGVHAWTQQGGELPTFDTSGLKFSVGVRDERGTPVVTAKQLVELRQNNADVVVLDTRTTDEFAKGHVPGAISVPGAELLYRFADVVPSRDTQVLVSCAGLPRAILGAQTLRDAKVANPVSYLDDGTRGWTDHGGTLETGLTAQYPSVSADGERFATAHAANFGDRLWDEVDEDTAHAWRLDTTRTTYLLDVRTPAEFARGSLPGAIGAEGGQLLGVSHRTLAVRGARVILLDNLAGLRAKTVAHWLQRRGFEIVLLRHDFAAD
jgi:rhodanese-related sulfurtransferase